MGKENEKKKERVEKEEKGESSKIVSFVDRRKKIPPRNANLSYSTHAIFPGAVRAQ
jgi:hypothetical protein